MPAARMRWHIEQGAGWIEMVGGLRRLSLVNMADVRGSVTVMLVDYDLIRLREPECKYHMAYRR